MEQIVFPVPNICSFLTNESKLRVYYGTERDEQGSKINDFFLHADDLFNEMRWQKKLRGKYVFVCFCLYVYSLVFESYSFEINYIIHF